MWQISKPIIRFGQSAIVGLICRRAVRTSHASAGSSRVGPRHGQGCRGARVGPAMRAAGGMQVSRVGLQPGRGRGFARLIAAPLARVCSSRRAQPRPRPGFRPRASAQGGAVACVFSLRLTAPLRGSVRRAGLSRPRPHPLVRWRLAALPGRPLPAWQALPRAPHGTPAHGATALGSCACVACAHRRRQRWRLRRSPCPCRPSRIPGPQTAGDGPQAVPGELVCLCARACGYFTRRKPTMPSGSAT